MINRDIVVENVKVGVIISDLCLKFNADNPKRFADDPELTIKAYFFPNNFAIFFSNNFTLGPL